MHMLHLPVAVTIVLLCPLVVAYVQLAGSDDFVVSLWERVRPQLQVRAWYLPAASRAHRSPLTHQHTHNARIAHAQRTHDARATHAQRMHNARTTHAQRASNARTTRPSHSHTHTLSHNSLCRDFGK